MLNLAEIGLSFADSSVEYGSSVGALERLRLTLAFESTSGPPPR